MTRGEPNCDAVILTHYHGDHVGLYEKILPGIPIYIGETAKKIYLTLTKHLYDHRHATQTALLCAENFCTYLPKETLTFGGIKVTPFYTDHSAYDAYMLLIEADGKRVLHTGDFRTHGTSGPGVLKCLNYYVGKVDAVICEGTGIERDESPKTQRELENEADALMRANQKVFVLCSSTNLDHIRAIRLAAHKNFRMFICDEYQHRILEAANAVKKPNARIYVYDRNLDPHMAEKGFCMLVRVKNSDSRRLLSQFKDQCLLIYSMWMGYLSSCRIEETAALVESCPNRVYLHTSGHASRQAIKQVLEIVRPGVVIPIHTEAQNRFKGLCPGITTVCLNNGERFEL